MNPEEAKLFFVPRVSRDEEDLFRQTRDRPTGRRSASTLGDKGSPPGHSPVPHFPHWVVDEDLELPLVSDKDADGVTVLTKQEMDKLKRDVGDFFVRGKTTLQAGYLLGDKNKRTADDLANADRACALFLKLVRRDGLVVHLDHHRPFLEVLKQNQDQLERRVQQTFLKRRKTKTRRNCAVVAYKRDDANEPGSRILMGYATYTDATMLTIVSELMLGRPEIWRNSVRTLDNIPPLFVTMLWLYHPRDTIRRELKAIFPNLDEDSTEALLISPSAPMPDNRESQDLMWRFTWVLRCDRQVAVSDMLPEFGGMPLAEFVKEKGKRSRAYLSKAVSRLKRSGPDDKARRTKTKGDDSLSVSMVLDANAARSVDRLANESFSGVDKIVPVEPPVTASKAKPQRSLRMHIEKKFVPPPVTLRDDTSRKVLLIRKKIQKDERGEWRDGKKLVDERALQCILGHEITYMERIVKHGVVPSTSDADASLTDAWKTKHMQETQLIVNAAHVLLDRDGRVEKYFSSMDVYALSAMVWTMSVYFVTSVAHLGASVSVVQFYLAVRHALLRGYTTSDVPVAKAGSVEAWIAFGAGRMAEFVRRRLVVYDEDRWVQDDLTRVTATMDALVLQGCTERTKRVIKHLEATLQLLDMQWDMLLNQYAMLHNAMIYRLQSFFFSSMRSHTSTSAPNYKFCVLGVAEALQELESQERMERASVLSTLEPELAKMGEERGSLQDIVAMLDTQYVAVKLSRTKTTPQQVQTMIRTALHNLKTRGFRKGQVENSDLAPLELVKESNRARFSDWSKLSMSTDMAVVAGEGKKQLSHSGERGGEDAEKHLTTALDDVHFHDRWVDRQLFLVAERQRMIEMGDALENESESETAMRVDKGTTHDDDDLNDDDDDDDDDSLSSLSLTDSVDTSKGKQKKRVPRTAPAKILKKIQDTTSGVMVTPEERDSYVWGYNVRQNRMSVVYTNNHVYGFVNRFLLGDMTVLLPMREQEHYGMNNVSENKPLAPAHEMWTRAFFRGTRRWMVGAGVSLLNRVFCRRRDPTTNELFGPDDNSPMLDYYRLLPYLVHQWFQRTPDTPVANWRTYVDMRDAMWHKVGQHLFHQEEFCRAYLTKDIRRGVVQEGGTMAVGLYAFFDVQRKHTIEHTALQKLVLHIQRCHDSGGGGGGVTNDDDDDLASVERVRQRRLLSAIEQFVQRFYLHCNTHIKKEARKKKRIPGMDKKKVVFQEMPRRVYICERCGTLRCTDSAIDLRSTTDQQNGVQPSTTCNAVPQESGGTPHRFLVFPTHALLYYYCIFKHRRPSDEFRWLSMQLFCSIGFENQETPKPLRLEFEHTYQYDMCMVPDMLSHPRTPTEKKTKMKLENDTKKYVHSVRKHLAACESKSENAFSKRVWRTMQIPEGTTVYTKVVSLQSWIQTFVGAQEQDVAMVWRLFGQVLQLLPVCTPEEGRRHLNPQFFVQSKYIPWLDGSDNGDTALGLALQKQEHWQPGTALKKRKRAPQPAPKKTKKQKVDVHANPALGSGASPRVWDFWFERFDEVQRVTRATLDIDRYSVLYRVDKPNRRGRDPNPRYDDQLLLVTYEETFFVCDSDVAPLAKNRNTMYADVFASKEKPTSLFSPKTLPECKDSQFPNLALYGASEDLVTVVTTLPIERVKRVPRSNIVH